METKQYKRLTNVNSYKKAEVVLQRWCHLYIRLRDMELNRYGKPIAKCIACGKVIEVQLYSDNSIMNGKKLHASHYFNSDKYASVRYDEDNLHLSCYNCNRMLSGNKEHYQHNLIQRIGKRRFNDLEKRKNQIDKKSILDIIELTEVYKQKAKTEAKRLGVKI